MAELSTPALRGTIREFSGNVVLCSEMLSAGAVASRAPHNEPLLQKLECDDPFIYQIVGSRPDVMAEACAVLSARGCYAIDLNMGCAAPEIIKTGAGARLLADAGAARRVVRACRKATPVKLSVKMRAGFDDADEARLVDFARMLEDEGVDFNPARAPRADRFQALGGLVARGITEAAHGPSRNRQRRHRLAGEGAQAAG